MDENNNKQTSSLYQVIDILPQYTRINTVYQEILRNRALNFEEQCQITDFRNWLNNRETFEKAVLDFILFTDNEKQFPIVSILRKLIYNNIEIYKNNHTFFDEIDTLIVCSKRPNFLNDQINNQQSQTNAQWVKLKETRNSLESASWIGEESKIEHLTKEEERISTLYEIEQEKLSALYKQKAESDTAASKYVNNIFKKIYESGIFNLVILDNYFPDESQGKDSKQSNSQMYEGKYFDMEIVSKIHKECNGAQFESLTEIELYSILNLLPAKTHLIIKNREKIRMCYLVSILYNYLKLENKTEWRTLILKSIGIKENFYNSKYKEPVSETPSRESKDFALSIRKIFT